MPIYAYRCAECGHAKDVLQKISDPVLTTCPACGADAFRKQLTAAGFQLKGSGWYVTDFRSNGANAAAKNGEGKGGEGKGGDAAAKPADAKSDPTAPAAPAAPSSGDSSPGGTTATAASCGGSCACH